VSVNVVVADARNQARFQFINNLLHSSGAYNQETAIKQKQKFKIHRFYSFICLKENAISIRTENIVRVL
jgi:hypothetical protein